MINHVNYYYCSFNDFQNFLGITFYFQIDMYQQYKLCSDYRSSHLHSDFSNYCSNNGGMCENFTPYLKNVATIYLGTVHQPNSYITLDQKLLLMGDVRVRIQAKQHLITKVCLMGHQTLFIFV